MCSFLSVFWPEAVDKSMYKTLKEQFKEMLDPVYDIKERPTWFKRLTKRMKQFWRPEPVKFTTATLSRSRFIA